MKLKVVRDICIVGHYFGGCLVVNTSDFSIRIFGEALILVLKHSFCLYHLYMALLNHKH